MFLFSYYIQVFILKVYDFWGVGGSRMEVNSRSARGVDMWSILVMGGREGNNLMIKLWSILVTWGEYGIVEMLLRNSRK